MEKLNCESLMMGDWVYLKNGKVLQPCKITVISNATQDRSEIGTTVCLDLSEEFPTCLFSIDSIEPIPLTPEILEKNGFTDWADHSRTTRSCSMLIDRTNIIVQKIDGTDYIFTQIHRGGADSCEFRMDLKYVHELQHALRLCGIEKTIEL